MIPATSASALLTALARGDELGLMEQAVGLEKWERDKLAALFEELIALLRDALALRAGGTPLCPPSCREAVEAVGTALTPGQMLQCVKQLEELRGVTKLIIAHRISAVRHADEILVLQEGRIAERGTHESLLRQKGLYYDTFVAQYEEPKEVSACL